MAQELLRGKSMTHLYRHDLESLFYIMLLMAARYTIGPTEGGPDTEGEFQVVRREGMRPHQSWLDTQDDHLLGYLKFSFISDRLPMNLSPAFEDFRPWLIDLRKDFANGFNYKYYQPSNRQQPRWRRKQAGRSVGGTTPTPVPSDDERLGGNVEYPSIVEPTRYLKGELEGLIIRYETTALPSPATPTGVDVQADT